MSKTEVSGKQVKDGSIELVDLSANLASIIEGKADAGNLAPVATSGSYDDLTNKPAIPSLTQVESDISALQATDVSLDSRLDSAEASLLSLDGRVDTLEAVVPFSGDYNDLTNKPAIPSLTQVESDISALQAADVALDSRVDALEAVVPFSGSYTDLTNKPALFSGSYVDLTGAPNLAAVATSGAYADLTGKPVLAAVATSGSYNDLSDKPSIPSLTGYATESYVNTKVADLVDSAPAVLNTLNELAAALNNEPNFAANVAGQIGALEADIAALQASSSNIPSIEELSGVGIVSPVSGQVLKYNGIAWANAADNTFSGDYNDLSNKPSLFSGSYTDLTNKPSLFSGTYADLSGAPVLATVATSGSYTDLSNKPSMISSLNSLTGSSQTFAVGTSGTDFAISSSGSTHTFNIPNASATARGLITTGTQTIAGSKTFSSTVNVIGPAYGGFLVQSAAGVDSRLLSNDTTNTGAVGTITDHNFQILTVNTARMTVDTGGKVGIGTSTPAERLHVNGALQFGLSAAPNSAWDTNTRIWAESGFGARYDSFSHRWDVGTNRTEAMRINSSGNIGIGASNPSNRLHLGGATQKSIRVDTASNSSFFGGFNNATVIGVNRDPATGTFVDSAKACSEIACLGNASNGYIIFSTTASNNTPPTEAMIITSSGNVGINTSNAGIGVTSKLTVAGGAYVSGNMIVGAADGARAFKVNGSNSGTAGGSYIVTTVNDSTVIAIGNRSSIMGGAFDNSPMIYGNGVEFKVQNLTAGAGSHAMKWNSLTGGWTYDTSSIRYKENVRDSIYGLEHVKQLQSRQYNYKADQAEDVGLIAEEVVGVIPELVPLNAEGQPDAVRYDRLVSVLVKAVQELDVKVETLEAEKVALEARITALEALEARIAALENK